MADLRAIKNPMFPDNISRIIRWYKGRCSFEMRKIHADFSWQFRFHDHIIRDAQSFDAIQNYIADNPINWDTKMRKSLGYAINCVSRITRIVPFYKI